MKVGIIGLGLIGGSLAKAYKASGNTIYGYDADEKILALTTADGVNDEILTKENSGECELVFLAIYPSAAVTWLEENARYIGKSATVIDACGVKQAVCEAGMRLASEFGFLFVGGHPMAGTHRSGYGAARADLFRGASMVIVPPVYDDIALLAKVKALLAPLGLGRIKVCTAKYHDEMIAYTSQMPHIAANAFVKSPLFEGHEGFSGGSFRDFTRVAELNETMWTELCMDNREILMEELARLSDNLMRYHDALQAQDKEALKTLFREGSDRKTGKKKDRE